MKNGTALVLNCCIFNYDMFPFPNDCAQVLFCWIIVMRRFQATGEESLTSVFPARFSA